jgi:hypothetical protein
MIGGENAMPDEIQLKRLISDAILAAYSAHGGQPAGDRLSISREDSHAIAAAVVDVLSRANVLLLDRPRDDQGAVQEIAAQNVAAVEQAKIKRKSMFGRVAARLLVAVLILGLGIGAYVYSTGAMDFSSLTGLVQRVIGSAQVERAAFYESSTANAPLKGTASWRIVSEGTRANPQPVLHVDVQIPERDLSLAMSIRRESSEAMSHLVELRFLRSDQAPFAEIIRLGDIAMTTAELPHSERVMGQTTTVTPGVFLFGLAPGKTERQQNLRFLRDLTWMEIPISYRNGTRALLLIEKGTAGERAINEFFNDSGQQ